MYIHMYCCIQAVETALKRIEVIRLVSESVEGQVELVACDQFWMEGRWSTCFSAGCFLSEVGKGEWYLN